MIEKYIYRLSNRKPGQDAFSDIFGYKSGLLFHCFTVRSTLVMMQYYYDTILLFIMLIINNYAT